MILDVTVSQLFYSFMILKMIKLMFSLQVLNKTLAAALAKVHDKTT